LTARGRMTLSLKMQKLLDFVLVSN